MDVSAILLLLAGKFPIVALVLGVLGVLVVAGQAVVILTPTKSDDEAWAKIKAVPLLGVLIAAIAEFAPLQKK